LLKIEFLEAEQSQLRRELERQQTMQDRIEEFARSMHIGEKFPDTRPYTSRD